jgi:hypothetical protein
MCLDTLDSVVESLTSLIRRQSAYALAVLALATGCIIGVFFVPPAWQVLVQIRDKLEVQLFALFFACLSAFPIKEIEIARMKRTGILLFRQEYRFWKDRGTPTPMDADRLRDFETRCWEIFKTALNL